MFFLSVGTNTFTQNNIFAVGSNSSLWINKLYGGLQFSILKKEKNHSSRPNWIVKFNYGLLGNNHLKVSEVDTTGGFITIIRGSSGLPYLIEPLPKNNEIGLYYTKEHYIKNIGYFFSISKEFKLRNNFFWGLGIAYANIRDKGYLIWENPFSGNSIKKDINVNVSIPSFSSNLGYHYCKG